jgi:hypothetical protein
MVGQLWSFDELKREFSGKTIEVNGSFYGATLLSSKCDVFLPGE